MLELVRSPVGESENGFVTSERRYAVMLKATLIFEGHKSVVHAKICNISAKGLFAKLQSDVKQKGLVSVTIPHLGLLSGRVAWVGELRIGIQFDEEIDPLILLAERAVRVAKHSNGGAIGVNQLWEAVSQKHL
jgi:PilZ domain